VCTVCISLSWSVSVGLGRHIPRGLWLFTLLRPVPWIHQTVRLQLRAGVSNVCVRLTEIAHLHREFCTQTDIDTAHPHNEFCTQTDIDTAHPHNEFCTQTTIDTAHLHSEVCTQTDIDTAHLHSQFCTYLFPTLPSQCSDQVLSANPTGIGFYWYTKLFISFSSSVPSCSFLRLCLKIGHTHFHTHPTV